MPGKKTKNARSSAKTATVNTVPEPAVPAPVQPDVLPAPAASESVETSPAPGGIDEAKLAAVALNLCMVSLSQIVDYNDVNILRMEYESILNNINMEYFPKDDALFDALNAILDTCHFFMLHEKDKDLLKKKQALKLKAGLSNINFFGVISTGNPYVAAASLAMMIGVAAVNYKTQKAKAEYENEAEKWALEKSALEQLHRLRGALFATAWRLADKYRYPDAWRLSEKQIRLYDEILADPDPFSRLNRLETIQDKFEAYPPFFYYMAHAAIETANDDRHKEDKVFKKEMYDKAESALKKFNDDYSKAELLREDLVAASAFLDWAEILFSRKNWKDALQAVNKARKLAGLDFMILQNCAFHYCRIVTENTSKMRDDLELSTEAEKQAIKCLEILVANEYNLDPNSKILSCLYIRQGEEARARHDILLQLFSSRSVFPYRHVMPWKSAAGVALLKNDLMKSYQEEAGNFFKTDKFLYVLFKSFEGSIQNFYSDLLNAISGTIRNEDSTPLFQYFETHGKNEPGKEFCSFVTASFVEFRRKFALNVSYDSIPFNAFIRDCGKELSTLLSNLKEHSKRGLFSKEPIPSMKEIKDYRKNFLAILESDKLLRRKLSFIAYFAGCFLFDVCLKQHLNPEKMNQIMFDLLDYLEMETERNRKKILKTNPVFSYVSFEEFKKYHKENKPKVDFITIKKKAEAEENSGDDQYKLGGYYENGYGVRKDLSEARSWYEKAAKQGHEGAKKKIAQTTIITVK